MEIVTGRYPPALTRLLTFTEASVIAHRGGSKLRPENTMAAFDHAAALGVHALECDVHLSSDGHPVVIHDPTLERTTNGTGPVSAMTAAALAGLDAGHLFAPGQGFPFRGQGIGVPRLADLLRRHPGLPLVIEVKGTRADTATRVVEVVREAGAADRVIIGGFSDVVLRAVRALAPGVPTSACQVEVQSAVRRAWLRLAPRRTGFMLMQVPFRYRGRRLFGRPFVAAAHRGRLPVHAWIIDDPDDMRRLLGWGVTGLISDRPDVALQVLAERQAAR